ncbi:MULTISPECIES: MBL fold metallo-hydrolase [unclassified Streptomyces]|uniref:MBL fold metallo-hydrolase n=1 Tax=unclassified Streptomyces TaxID=2593676 RepID=UPI00037E466A|nr:MULTISPECIES: MBL fold metallo-hydrolase [unclassified Streptomyces]MYT32139.1 MBL fold metallo-hydrolase [Streptomyces sp. SID8354]
MRTTWEEAGWERLGEGVVRRRMPGWDETIGVVAGSDGVLIVDTGATLGAGAELRRTVRAVLGRGVTHVALTHPHFDHVLGTAAFAGVEVFGAAGVGELLRHGKEALRDDAVRHGVDPDAAAEAADLLVVPHHEVHGRRTVGLGDREVLLADVGPGHTPHDLAVLVPGRAGERAVVFCGDLVEESGEPQAGPDALPGRWPAALDRLLALGGEDAVYVPGHGAVVDAGFVRAQRDALAARPGTDSP